MKNLISFLILSISIASSAQINGFWKPTNQSEFDSLFFKIEENYLGDLNMKKEQAIVKRLYEIADSIKNPILLSRALYFDVRNRLYLKSDSIDFLLQKQLSLIDEKQNSYDYARAKFLQGDYYDDTGNIVKAYKIWQEQLTYFRSISDYMYIANTLSRMGVVLAKINENHRALSLLKEANLYYEKANQTIFSRKNLLNISNTLYKFGEIEMANNNLNSLINDSSVAADTAFLINVMLSLFSHSSTIKDKEIYAEKNYLLAKQFGNKDLIIKAGVNYVSFLSRQEDYNQSLKILNKLLKISAQLNDIEGYRLIYGNKAAIYTEKEQWDSAYYYTNLYHIYSDSILGADKVIEINKIEAREAIRKIEQEKKESELKRKIILAILFGVCCLSIAIISIIYFKKKKTEMQKKLKEAENEQLEAQVNFKNRELASNTLLLTEKNRVLEDLSKQLKELEFQGNIPAREEKLLRKKIEDHLKTGNEWEYFKLHFENVHPEFFSKLKLYFPMLSENDLRLCAYIRIGLEAKQIAQMLSVMPNTIKTSRYRLRKKLNLAGENSLENFLREL
ncbi:MAG: LuxR C-terminal-related transcriptional regulator [Weeksellaceae bacterium]